MTELLEEKLERWHEMSIELKQIKSDEMKLRKEIADEISRDHTGTYKETVGDYLVTVNRKLQRKVDEQALSAIISGLDEDELSCLKTSNTIVVANYNTLSHKAMLHEAVIIKTGTPELKLKHV